MSDVTFGYGSSAHTSGGRTSGNASQPVLDHVSLDVSPQGILGIQGPSGRGKSTMLKLLMRYWDPDSGTISLSDVPLPQVDAGWRRRVQTMMGQETYLFDGTIRENLAIACNDADFSDSGSNSGSNFCSNSSSNAGGDSADSSDSDLAHDIPDSVLREALAKRPRSNWSMRCRTAWIRGSASWEGAFRRVRNSASDWPHVPSRRRFGAVRRADEPS